MNINYLQNKNLQSENLINVGNYDKSMRTANIGSELSVDITGKNKENAGFSLENLKSFDEIKTKMKTKDVTVESNALAVMSNTMSGEDFAKLQENGFNASDMTPEETVTSLDKIKATLAMSGVDIPGYTDDIPKEAMEKIAGSLTYAQAIESALKENQIPATKENVIEISDVLKMSEMVTKPSDNAKAYMLENELDPTVNNFYMSNHSATESGNNNRAGFYKDPTGYVGKNSTEANIEELRPQIEKILTESGIDVNEKTFNDAKWLIDKNVPLTKENLERLNDINAVAFPIDKDIVAKSSAAAIADGYKVKDASLNNTESVVTKAVKFIDEVSSDLTARRLLEETRLHLTLDASISLMKKGIDIDTTDLTKLVEELKQAEKEAYAPFLMEEKYEDVPKDRVKIYEDELELKIDLFKQVSKSVDDIKSAPVEIAGSVAKASIENQEITLSDLSKASNQLKADYEKAGKSYETMMTAPRADMGDSIKKAFRNVDDILESMDIEVNRLNEKSVRALGYAGMEISEENVALASKALVAVENLISNMTPAKVLNMIRDGENPLNEDIYKLSEKITNRDEDKDNEKFSEFLFKLERSGEITELEKTAFIGMYRLFRKIEKSDGKLVGEVLKADEKLTLSNIISASRSDRQLNTDIKIDDSFGALEKLVTFGESITDQILSGFNTKELNTEYAKAEAKAVREAVQKEAAVLEALENVDEPESPVNISAMDALINMRGSLFKGLNKYFGDDKKQSDEFKQDILDLQDSFDDEESVDKAYKTFTEKTKETVKNFKEFADDYIDVKSMKLINKQLTLVSGMVKNRTYEVPVEINGELTSINLKIVNDSDDAGKINVSFETEATGKVNAEFTLRNGEVSGFIVTENSYYEGLAKEGEDGFRDELSKAGVSVSSMYYTSSRRLTINGNYLGDEAKANDAISTKQLYQVSKAIIKAIQK